MKTYYHRVEVRTYACLGGLSGDEVTGTRIQVSHFKFEVLKETPKGVWIDCCFDKRFILKKCKKQFASPTLEVAIEKFKKRNARYQQILRARLKGAEEALICVENHHFES